MKEPLDYEPKEKRLPWTTHVWASCFIGGVAFGIGAAISAWIGLDLTYDVFILLMGVSGLLALVFIVLEEILK